MRLAIARRLVRETEAASKLAILQRLQRRYVECRLPRESESRVEQSFNEQLFARVLGYRTLLSHDSLPYHLRPKNYAAGARRYDDFSLGHFWGDERDAVFATAEFKDPGTELDAPQTDRKEKLTPVAQAFRAARGFPTCAWVIVSNFRELRLYHVDDDAEPIVVLDLHEIRTRRQLASLSAYFDYDALASNRRTSGMNVALDPRHPSAPVSASEGAFRLICTFVPRDAVDLGLPLVAVYDAVRETAIELIRVERDEWDRSPKVPTTIEDGWCSVETEDTRLAVSTEGQVRCSARRRRRCSPAQNNPDAGFWRIAEDIHDFLRIVAHLYRCFQQTFSGVVSFELREIKGWSLYFPAGDLLKKNDDTNGGVAERDEILSGDFLWTVGRDSPRIAADCMGELALQFKAPGGSRVRFDHAALANQFQSTE